MEVTFSEWLAWTGLDILDDHRRNVLRAAWDAGRESAQARVAFFKERPLPEESQPVAFSAKLEGVFKTTWG